MTAMTDAEFRKLEATVKALREQGTQTSLRWRLEALLVQEQRARPPKEDDA